MTYVALDGIIYQMQATGGISRLYNEILPRMCALDPDLFVRIYASPPTRQQLPVGPQIGMMALLRHDLALAASGNDCIPPPTW